MVGLNHIEGSPFVTLHHIGDAIVVDVDLLSGQGSPLIIAHGIHSPVKIEIGALFGELLVLIKEAGHINEAIVVDIHILSNQIFHRQTPIFGEFNPVELKNVGIIIPVEVKTPEFVAILLGKVRQGRLGVVLVLGGLIPPHCGPHPAAAAGDGKKDTQKRPKGEGGEVIHAPIFPVGGERSQGEEKTRGGL